MRGLLFSAFLLAAPMAAHAQAAPIVAEGTAPGASIQMRDLRRDAAGNLMLRMVLINDSCCGISGVMLREKSQDGGRPSGVKLTDPATGKAHRPMRGPDGECVCGEMPNTSKGDRANLWVKFAGVPATVTTATVEVQGYEPVDVPVQGPAPATLAAEGGTPGQQVQVRDLKRDAAGALMLRYTFINNSCCGVSSVMLRELDTDAKPSGVKLIDEATQTAYVPARLADGQCACSDMPNTGRGERANLWVKFAEVPPGLKTASVVVRTFEPVTGVPITGP